MNIHLKNTLKSDSAYNFKSIGWVKSSKKKTQNRDFLFLFFFLPTSTKMHSGNKNPISHIPLQNTENKIYPPTIFIGLMNSIY